MRRLSLGLALVLLARIQLRAQDQYLAPVRIGTIADSRVLEPSGAVPVTGLAGHYWVHNDSGDIARIFAVHETGRVIAEVRITGASAVDWEDISRGPAPGSDLPHLFVADTGNNDLSRTQVVIYRFVEPVLASTDSGQKLASQPADAFPVQYPDGSKNCEALIVDPSSGDMYVIAKQAGPASVYRIPSSQPDGSVQTLVKLGTVATSDLVTAAEPSRDGRRLLVRTYSLIYEYRIAEDAEFAGIFFAPWRILPDSAEELKGESICFDHRDADYLTIDELLPANIHRSSVLVPQERCEVPEREQAPFVFVRGDLAPDRPARTVPVDLADLVALEDLVASDEEISCPDSADVNDDGVVDEADVDELADDLVAGAPPPGPFPDSGHDLTADPLGCNDDGRQVLLADDAFWSFWSRPSPPPDAWVEAGFDDSGWDRGPGGVGYGVEGLGTELAPFGTSHVTLFARSEFSVDSPESFDGLLLSIDYNDGVVAFLNGIEIARAGLDGIGHRVPFNTLARPRSDRGFLEIPICKDLLVSGGNTLALQIHGRSFLLDREIYFRAAVEGRLASAPPPPLSSGDEAAEVSIWLDADGPPDLEHDSVLTVHCEAEAPFRAVGFTVAHDPRRTRIVRIERGVDAGASSYFDGWVDTSRGLASTVLTFAPDDALAGGRELEIARLVYRTIGAGEGEQIHFRLENGPPPLELENSVALERGGISISEPDQLTLAVPEPKLPVIVLIHSGSGGEGSKFLIFGERLDAPGLEVRVCGRVAEYEVVSEGEVLEVVAPACEELGPASVVVCWIYGCDQDASGFLYQEIGPPYLRGDANGDGTVDISDPILLLGFLFLGQPQTATCPLALDANDDGKSDISDAIVLLDFLFLGSFDLPPPFPEPAPCPAGVR